MNDNQRLKYIREKTGLSQSKFAQEIDFPAGKINHIENGSQKISVELAQKLSKNYGYSFEWIMTGEGSPFKTYEEMQEEADKLVPPEVTALFNKYMATNDEKYLWQIEAFIRGLKAGQKKNE